MKEQFYYIHKIANNLPHLIHIQQSVINKFDLNKYNI